MTVTASQAADLLVCGSCRRDFPLCNIVNFVDHKKLNCAEQPDEEIGSDLLSCQSCMGFFATPWNLLQHAQNVHSLNIYQLKRTPTDNNDLATIGSDNVATPNFVVANETNYTTPTLYSVAACKANDKVATPNSIAALKANNKVATPNCIDTHKANGSTVTCNAVASLKKDSNKDYKIGNDQDTITIDNITTQSTTRIDNSNKNNDVARTSSDIITTPSVAAHERNCINTDNISNPVPVAESCRTKANFQNMSNLVVASGLKPSVEKSTTWFSSTGPLFSEDSGHEEIVGFFDDAGLVSKVSREEVVTEFSAGFSRSGIPISAPVEIPAMSMPCSQGKRDGNDDDNNDDDEDDDVITAEATEKIECTDGACTDNAARPHTHSRLKRCCSAVVPKKRKRHIETKHFGGTKSKFALLGGGRVRRRPSLTGGFVRGGGAREEDGGPTDIYIDVEDVMYEEEASYGDTTEGERYGGSTVTFEPGKFSNSTVTFEPGRYVDSTVTFEPRVGPRSSTENTAGGASASWKQVVNKPGAVTFSIPVGSYQKSSVTPTSSRGSGADLLQSNSLAHSSSSVLSGDSGLAVGSAGLAKGFAGTSRTLASVTRNVEGFEKLQHPDKSSERNTGGKTPWFQSQNNQSSENSSCTFKADGETGAVSRQEVTVLGTTIEDEAENSQGAVYGSGGVYSSQGGYSGGGEGGGGGMGEGGRGAGRRRYPTSRPFKCEECSDAFNQRIHLRKHQSKHTGVKPFKCDHCDYSTVERSHLKVHIRVHTGEKPYKCSSCEYATAQNSTLKIHLKRRHHSLQGEPPAE